MSDLPNNDQPKNARSSGRTWLSRAYIAGLIILVPVLMWPMVKGMYYGVFPPPRPSPENLPAWRADYAAALEESANTGKPVLIDFTASWCPPCRVMEAEVWPHEAVRAAIDEHVIPLQLDVDAPNTRRPASQYGVRSIPTVVVVDSKGTELARGGIMSADEMVAFVTQNFAPRGTSE